MKRVVLLGVVLLGVMMLFNSDVNAQCSMCRASLVAANGRFLQNFNTAVLVLLIPPVTIFCSIFVVLRKHGRSRDDQDAQ